MPICEGTAILRLSAEIHTERLIGDERAAIRRTLRLGVSSYSSSDVATALILNLSERGLLIETFVELAVGEVLAVDISEASASAIRVIWTDNFLAGCEFIDPLSAGAVSAAQLKSPHNATGAADSVSAAGAYFSPEVLGPNPDGSSIQTAILIVTSLISAMALILLLAAILLRS
jgi:hypothetical protein